jgi:lipid-binding SYLF domain-containing protein
MKKNLAIPALSLLMLSSLLADDKSKSAKEDERLEESATVVKEIMAMDAGLPQGILDKAECVLVYPGVKKGAFIVGGSYGRGAISCRSGKDLNGQWSTPAMYALEGMSFGLQAGGQATDFVLLIMNEGGANSVMSSKVKLGGDARWRLDRWAGQLRRDRRGDESRNTLVFTLPRSICWAVSGWFDNAVRRWSQQNLYGKELSAKQIIRESVVKLTQVRAIICRSTNEGFTHAQGQVI